MRTFQLSDAKSHKFWNIDVSGADVTVTYGKVGTAGTTQTKTYDTAEKAQAEADKLVREKTKKGYAETTPTAPKSDAEAFEAALRANPDELATACAYADYLAEQGDPRGEFMQVQIALEDESRSKAERDVLRQRETELLAAHKAEWVGDWAAHPDINERAQDWVQPPGWVPYTFTRGLLTGIEFGDLTRSLARQVAAAPGLGQVRDLAIHGYAYEEGDEDAGDEGDEDAAGPDNEYPAQPVALRWPFLPQIRTFRFGGEDPAEEYDDWCPHRSHMPGEHVHDFVKQMPAIESLHVMAHVRDANKLVALPMPRLRVFLLYHGWSYPLERLAKNPTLGHLAELYCHPHALEHGDSPYIRLHDLQSICRSKYLTGLTRMQLRMCDAGDAGIEEIVRSSLLKRLKVLDLRHGVVTDDGAKALARCPDLTNLTRLDLSRNRLTQNGIDALTKTGVDCHLVRQADDQQETWETFGQGDIE